MKLSEAILKGSQLRPQGFGQLFGFDLGVGKEFDYITSDALGAAYEACNRGYSREYIDSDTLYDLFPILKERVPSPCGCAFKGDLRAVVVHLNDGHRWKREAIAAWVKKVEAKRG